MARPARHALPGVPLHLVQRGIDRQPIFHTDRDRKVFLSALDGAARAHGVQVHSYVLMPNHVHLLVTGQQADSVSRMMQSLGRRYVRHVNDTHGRAGTLWDGRYKACLVDSGPWLMAVHRYIELNPVRAGLVLGPADYPWSSCQHHVGQRRDPLVSDPAAYWALGNTPFDREMHYRRWLDEGSSEAEQQALVDSALKGWPLGSPKFLAELAKTALRPVSPRPRGRPPGSAKPSDADSVPN